MYNSYYPMYQQYQSNYPYNYQKQYGKDDRILFPFLLGGLTGAAIARPYPYFRPLPYYAPPYPFYY